MKTRKKPSQLGSREYEKVAPVLRVLGHPDRLRMVDVLMREQLSVAQLAETLELAPNAVSQHLGIMRAHGIVRRQRRGRQVFYGVVHPAAQSLLRCMWRHGPDL